ncbi:MAG: 2-hydroxyacyl-CoA dehydratase family protein, partial [Dehalococcoidia bacterium]|nr:2-hydroxyacyl-CoA dehydratase family protein [Dehalococcoidia bacterium]
LEALESMLRHRRKNPTHPNDELFYELLLQYYTRLREAALSGKFIAAYTVTLPTEILYAMDIVPMQLEGTAGTLAIVLKNQDELLSTAKAMGYPPEVCSAHRTVAAVFSRGWAPRPNVILWSPQVCDNTAKCGDQIMDSYGIPGIFIDRPYRFTEREVQYLTAEFEEMVARLEELSGHRLDMDRLRQALEHSARMVELLREIYELRRAVPYPTTNRRSNQVQTITWLFQGTETGVRYVESVRNELRERVARGEGYAPNQRHRLIGLFLPPNHAWKLLDWMEREHGACIVAEPYSSHWGPWQPDFSRPVESLARKQFICPICRQMHGPMEEGVVADAVSDARTHGAEGAIYWAHTGCRQACATIRATKDALMEQLGIPTLVLDIDLL